MRQSLFLPTAVLIFAFANSQTVFAQGHDTPLLNNCIRQFYDPEMYNYLAFKNNCSQSLTVVFIAKDGSGAVGSMDLRPGAKDAVGKLKDGATPKVDGFHLYVCSLGEVPVDEKGALLNKPISKFRCQPKPQ